MKTETPKVGLGLSHSVITVTGSGRRRKEASGSHLTLAYQSVAAPRYPTHIIQNRRVRMRRDDQLRLIDSRRIAAKRSFAAGSRVIPGCARVVKRSGDKNATFKTSSIGPVGMRSFH